MYDDNNNDVFVIDLTGCMGTEEIINSISLALEIPNAANKKINLKFKDTVLKQSQLLTIKSLVSSSGSVLNNIETTSSEMREICDNLGLNCTLVNQIKIDENKIVIPEFQAQSETQTPEEFYVKQSEELSFENEIKEEDLPNQEINIEEAIHQSAKVAFENATNLDFMQEIIEEAKVKEEAFQQIDSEPVQNSLFDELEKDYTAGPESNLEERIFEAVKLTVKDEILYADNSETEETKQSFTHSDTQESTADSSPAPLYDLPGEGNTTGETNVIGVYKKAYEEEKEEYEEIDFFAPPTDEPVVVDSTKTIYVNQTLRSGQVLEFDGNIVIIGDCHPGSEIKASGDITVWGVLGSIAHAGIKGNTEAKIRALKMNAVQLRIANCYSRRPDGTNIPYIIRSSTFTPEEARICDDGIVLYKII